VLKTYERLLDWYIREKVLSQCPLNRFQFAYQAGVSTTTALHEMVTRIERTLDRGQLAIGVYIDVEGAFSQVPTDSMVAALRRFNTPEIMVRWIEKALLTRNVTAESQGVSVTSLVTRGTAQGGVLSAIVWNMTIDGILTKIQEAVPSVHKQAYSDDISILATGFDPCTVRDRAEQALHAAATWCQEQGLRVNPSKTEVVLFTFRKSVRFPELKLDGVTIPTGQKTKYLGLTLDSKLTWKPHIDEKVSKTKRILAQCRRAVGKTWGLKPRNMMWLYTSIVRPVISYGVTIWGPALQKHTNCNKLMKIQRLACLATTGVMRSTPTAGMEVILGLLPLDLFLKQEAVRGMFQLRRTNRWYTWNESRKMTWTAHGRWCMNIAGPNRLLDMPTDYTIPRKLFEKRFQVKIPERKEWENLTCTFPLSPNQIHCYSDGSRADGQTGAGVAIWGPGNEKEEIQLPLGKEASVFQAEMVAILTAAESLLYRGSVNTDVQIFTDSQASLKALTKLRCDSKLTALTFEKLNALSSCNDVTLTWIPGHTGKEGNEAADMLAKKAAGTKIMGPWPTLPVSRRVVMESVSEIIWKWFKENWEEEETCRQTKESTPVPLRGARAREIVELPRKQLRIIVGLRTGHCPLNRHLQVMGIRQSPDCEACPGTEETPVHFIAECPRYGFQRLQNFGHLFLNEQEIWSSPIRKLISFVNETKRLCVPFPVPGLEPNQGQNQV
jgi:ribonuclease HI